ncbi:hypothetical protein LXL04_031468 [Taraxacum kok-saghyz]
MDSWSLSSVVTAVPDDESLSIENRLFGDVRFPPLMRNSLISEDNVSRSIKLGSLFDQRDAQILKASKVSHNLSQSEVSTPLKRRRDGGFGSSPPFCKVHGCNKNLINCKEYHKRHKVCEVHSKTSKVIVNGIEQRFCQQCSRFHVLCEFDDGKRSCRKRLAGHNERRRKPHAGVISHRHGSFFPSYNIKFEAGNDFKRSPGGISSFSIPNELSSLYLQKHETHERSDHDLQSISCVTDEQMHSKSLWPCNIERNPRFNGYIDASTSVSTGLSRIASSSGSALSLLSSQSWSTTSCLSSRIQTSNNSKSHSLWFPGGH